MRKRIKLILSFIWKAKNGGSSAQKSLPQLVSITDGKLYDSPSSLTLDRFIKCAVDNDLSQLKINPLDNVPEITLTQVWASIYETFLDGMQDKEGMRKSKLYGKINNLEFTYELVQLVARFLTIGYHPEVIETLRKHMRVTGNFNPDNPEEYKNDIQVILNRAQGMKAEIKTIEIELNAIKAYEKPGEKTTRKQFDQLIAHVSIYAKFHIDKKIVSVSEFIEYYISRRENIETLEEQHQRSQSIR